MLQDDDYGGWYLELSIAARMVVYITFLGTIMFIIFMLLKFLSELDMEDDTERLPIMSQEVTAWTPLVNNKDLETTSFSSSDDVDYSTLCVICFEERRDCFFVPCGHSATCRGCARKIMSEENKVCPICRRVIRKSKRLLLKL
ncbi:unnamed protein product [Cochlearia groenlandica]